MTVEIIPDVHGDHVDPRNDVDHVICLGDYWDSTQGNSFDKQLNSFYVLAKRKEVRPEETTLLLGNHDVQYIYAQDDRRKCANKNYDKAAQIQRLFEEREDYFQYAKCLETPQGPIVFVHAGFTRKWLKNYNTFIDTSDPREVAALANMEPKEILWIGRKSHRGRDPMDGPLWVRPEQVVKEGLPPFHQIVGHTHAHPQFIYGAGGAKLQVVDHGYSTILRFV